MTNLKYLTVCNKITDNMKITLSEVPRRGGFYNWMFLFKGEISQFNAVEDFEKYDVIHVNGAPSDQILIPEIRRKLGNSSSTKLVMNNDHVCEIWEGWGMYWQHYHEAQRKCDMVFGTEPHQVSNMIDGAYCMPHPHWIHMLKRWGRPSITESIGYLYHWWENKTYIPPIWNYKLKEQGIKHKSRLYAYIPERDKSSFTKANWDELVYPMNYPEFMNHFISNKVVVDYCGYHTYGRSTVDCAAVGVPMVGSDRIESMNRCFPDIAHDPYDAKSIVSSIKKLWTNEKFYTDTIEKAREAVEYYNYKNAKQRFLAALEESERCKNDR